MKKLLALVLALVMTLSLAVVGSNAAFKDAEKVNASYAEAVDVLAGMKVFQGYPDNSFQPEGSITRAEVAAIVYRLYTADVADKQASLYATYNKFSDMNGAAWAAGYVGYCANAALIKGYDAKTFGPADKVTGYQALAMILRAVGYDKNDEFTGAQWQLRVASTAQQLGILKNVKGVDLNAAASRELVAELLFRTAAEVPMVTYTPALGYTNMNAIVYGTKNDTLGFKNFGLAEYKGYVVANEATGENYTVVAADRKGTTSFNLAHKTDLDMIGHKVSGWYDATSAKTDKYSVKYNATVYNMKDLSTAETVLTGAELAGKMNAKTVYSDNYSLFTKTAIDGTATKYIILDKGEAIISLVQDVAAVYAINNFATVPTMSLNYGEAKTLYKQSVLTGTEGLAIGDYVVTTDIAKKGEIIHLGKLDKTVNGVYSFKDSYNNITLADGTKLAKSPLFDKAQYKDGALTKSVVPQDASVLSIAVSGVYLLDEDGRYVGYWEVDNGYLYGTYAYYVVDNAATAQLSYYLTGVTIDGQVVTKKISAAQYNDTLIKNNVANLSTANQQIDANNKAHDYVVTETAATDLFKVSNWTSPAANVQTVTGTVIDKNSAVLGGTVNYFVDENTTFYFVTGTAAEPSVQTVTGKTALLGGGDNYVLPANSVMSVSVLNYSVNTAANYHVDKVLVKAPYSANTAKDLYYVGSNNAVYPVTGTNPQVNGVYVHKNADPAVTAYVTNSTVKANTFYTHNVVTNAYGQTVEALTEVPYATGLNGIKAYNDARTAAVGSYDLYLVDGTSTIRVSNDAAVVDLRTASYPGSTGTVGTTELKAISTYADLVKASAEYSFKVDAAGTSNNVTVVYIKSATIRDTMAQVDVSFTVKNSAGDTVAAPTADQGYTVLGGINNVGGAQKAGIFENVYFTVGKDVASVTVNGVAKNATSTWINGVWTENVYVVNASKNLDIVLTLKAPAAAAITLEKITHDGNKFTVDTKLATAIASGSMTKFVATVKTAAGVTVATKTQDFTGGWALTDHFTVDYATSVAHNQDFKVQLTIYNGSAIVAQSAETVLHLA